MAGALAHAVELSTPDFRVVVDNESGAVVGLFDGKGEMNWVGSSINTPWQPLGSRWGLGYFDSRSAGLHRYFWNKPKLSACGDTRCTVVYTAGPLQLTVNRKLDRKRKTFTETYSFKNTDSEPLNLAERGKQAFGIYMPFNDHYTNTTDALRSRSHAHIWANGGASAWVKLNQMGGLGRNLGLVLTKGALAGYSIEGRDTITMSNTRGVFLLNPDLPILEAGKEAVLEWTLFWHDDWEDFYSKAEENSDQFIRVDADRYTISTEESSKISLQGRLVDESTTVNGQPISCDEQSCTFKYSSSVVGEKSLQISTIRAGATLSSTIYLNIVPRIDDLVAARVKFITQRQQVVNIDGLKGAYVLYDNQMQGQVTFDKASDRNAGRERVGMGILIARWLKNNQDPDVEESLKKYYEFVCTKLQDENGYVLNGPGDRSKRLYNWSWVLQFHIVMASLGLEFTGPIANVTHLDRFMLTLENFYNEGGAELYSIGIPIYQGLKALNASGNLAAYNRALELFTNHASHIADTGLNYPPFEVNFEQSIVAPAAIMMFEMYRWTEEDKWLKAGEEHLKTLLRFSGKQPDYRLHDISIRHWDGYWFGKDRMWGDTFPHYWSTLTALALHHHSKITGDSSQADTADMIIRNNLALFDKDGRGSCAWIYPLSVNGRAGHYADPYANDQDWALAHALQIEADK